ncbi:SLATT domain-containing protein [Intestinimonas butyriciproducens]|uniref:SLATT domain-containing protein n=2 Tax=Intestinimonas butyriciproducens TaxID=1297617 RepID=UPI00051CA788|nr:SLATT domain-containing protein [Intestinimonas butyriciproducens]
MEQSLKNKLNRNIWITRKCRINASERLLSYAKYIEILNVYYSIFVIILSLISLTEQDNLLSIISLACSIALTISIIYANSASYRERSSSLKQNYIELQLLLDQLSCINDDDTECIMSISTKYAELLKASENHIPIDLYRLKISSTDSDFMLSSEEKRSYYCQLVWGYMWRAVLILLPIIAAVLYLGLG